MKVSILAASLFATQAWAASFTNNAIDPQPDQPFTLTWTGGSGPATILLKTGPTAALQTVKVLGSGLTAGTFTFTIKASDIPSGTYAFEIDDNTGPNYSKQFTFAGTGTGTPTGSPTVSPTSSSASTPTSSSSISTTSSSVSTTSTKSAASTSSTPSAAPTRPPNLNNAQRSASSLALVLVTVAALIYFN